MSPFKTLCLAASLAGLAAPASAALTYIGTGAYNLGSSASPGGTPASSVDCGSLQPFSGRDASEFNGSGADNIGIHAYACNDNGINDFGSRASGENTFYATGTSGVTGSLAVGEHDGFGFTIAPGEIGAFGSSAFGAGEFQRASLSIQLIIDGTSYVDLAWSAEVGTGGAITHSHTVGAGSLLVGTTEASGDGFFSYGLTGGSYFIDLAEGSHDISYLIRSEAAGNVTTTSVCSAVLQGGGFGNGDGNAGRPVATEPFTAYCGAGGRTGDPFGDPIARSQDIPLPEPMGLGLTLTALLAAAGAAGRGKR